jgi:hypothetical protein
MQIATTFDTYLEESNSDIKKALSLAKQDNFNAIGIMLNEPLDYYIKNKDLFKESKLKFCIHANITDTNIASLNEGISYVSVNTEF